MIGAVFAYVFAYVFVAVILAALLPIFYDDEPESVGDLGPEGRVVLALAVGMLWPLLVVVGGGWLIRAVARGIAQIARAVRPERQEIEPLPKATARRK